MTQQKPMLTNIRNVRIEWAQCDPAGIVFYPRYFEIFNASTMALLERAFGMKRDDYVKVYGIVGHPVAETRARFLKPTRYDDDVVIESTLSVTGPASFQIQHRLYKDGALAVEATKSRVWVARDPGDPTCMRPQPIPQEALARLSLV
jgi:4-hydroxybenzoyl-CoA thioesterase